MRKSKSDLVYTGEHGSVYISEMYNHVDYGTQVFDLCFYENNAGGWGIIKTYPRSAKKGLTQDFLAYFAKDARSKLIYQDKETVT